MCYFRVIARPLHQVSIEDIEYFRGLRFTWTKIAALLGISRSTYRRLREEGIDLSCAYFDISNADLNHMVQAIKMDHPNDGERLITGHLHRLGIVLPRYRIRACIHRIDPINTAIRSIVIRRRVYSVSGPNLLWHIDDNHKWRFIIHGGIDRYSRTITYLRCSTNNLASTVMVFFADVVSKYGVPDQVRSDSGGENMQVWQYMMEQHRSQASVLVGSSTHNDRIEHLWCDLHRCVNVMFADVFREMESDSTLSNLNEVDMYCLHTLYLPNQ